jgi:hypothetical protein
VNLADVDTLSSGRGRIHGPIEIVDARTSSPLVLLQ